MRCGLPFYKLLLLGQPDELLGLSLIKEIRSVSPLGVYLSGTNRDSLSVVIKYLLAALKT